jgi:hypothetical protein
VERIAIVPFQHPLLVIRLVPCGRNRIVNVPKPSDRVELVVGVFLGNPGRGVTLTLCHLKRCKLFITSTMSTPPCPKILQSASS